MYDDRTSFRRVDRLDPFQKHQEWRWMFGYPVIGPGRELKLPDFSDFAESLLKRENPFQSQYQREN